MASFSEDDNPIVFKKSTWQMRQRCRTEGTARLVDMNFTNCPNCGGPLVLYPLIICIFQCDNGHIACSECYKMFSQKCGKCSLPTLSRDTAMERVIGLIRVQCPHSGCSKIVSLYEIPTHVNHCPFNQPFWPFRTCDFTCSAKDLYKHSIARLCQFFPLMMLEFGTLMRLILPVGKRIILKEHTTEGEGEIVFVESFDVPDGRIFYARCIGPGTDEFSYQLKLKLASGDELLFNLNLQRASYAPELLFNSDDVTYEFPPEHFLLVPSCMLPCREFLICINRKTN